LLLRSLPFHQPDRLALLQQFTPPHDSAKQFHDWRQQSTYLSDAALFEGIEVNPGGSACRHPGARGADLGKFLLHAGHAAAARTCVHPWTT
jgi:hypothetical protein